MPKLLCETDGCESVLSPQCGTRGGLPICPRCRGVQYYWRKQGPKAMAAYRENLDFRVHRIDYLSAHIGKLIKDAKQRVLAARRSQSLHIH